MTITLGQIADLINAELINGTVEQPIHGVATLESAQPSNISFLTNFKHLQSARQSKETLKYLNWFLKILT